MNIYVEPLMIIASLGLACGGCVGTYVRMYLKLKVIYMQYQCENQSIIYILIKVPFGVIN